MSLDMTIGTQSADALAEPDAVALQPGTEAAERRRLWQQDLVMAVGTVFGVLFTSALSVLLFLR